MKTTRLFAMTAAGTLALASFALAASKTAKHDELPTIVSSMTAARISLADAITAAEAHVTGKAVRAKIDDRQGSFSYQIEVLKDDQLMDVKVDSRDGRVISANPDKADREDRD